jgi:predicted CXXCH cytochrome family protein
MEPAEHKVNVVPSMRVKGLPLSDGKITCVTCHDPHKNRYGKLLRVKAKELCLTCHKY